MKLFALALLLSIGATAQTTEDARKLTQKAKAIVFSPSDRNKAESMLRRAADIWEASDPISPEYAQVLVLLGMLHTGERGLNAEGIRVNVEPLYRKAVSIYNQNAAPADPLDAALALELEADTLDKLDNLDEANPLSARALEIRKKHIDDLQKDAPPPPDGSIKRIGGGISAPTVLTKVEPEYSEIARAIKHQGTVLFYLTVGSDGLPHNIRLMRSTGFGLDEEGLRALRTWRFNPAKDTNGQSFSVQTTIEFNFRLL